MNIPIIHEDDDVLVIDKPTDLAVHGDGVSEDKTLADWLLEEYPGLTEVGESQPAPNGGVIKRPGIVHRLDKETSGVLIIAKNQETFLFLKKQFQDHLARKTYRAILHGTFADLKIGEVQEINVPIGRSFRDPRQRVASLKAAGKLREAVTFFQVLEDFKNHCYIEAYPRSGRTHQLRVHFKYLNHPIVCDSLYCPKLVCLEGLERLALHAYKLEVDLPTKGKRTFLAELPADFQRGLECLRKVC